MSLKDLFEKLAQHYPALPRLALDEIAALVAFGSVYGWRVPGARSSDERRKLVALLQHARLTLIFNIVLTFLETARCAPPVAAGDAADGLPELTDRELAILQALQGLGATSRESRKKAALVAVHVLGADGDPQAVAHEIARLRGLGLLATKPGCAGGVWLTPRGIRALRRHRS